MTARGAVGGRAVPVAGIAGGGGCGFMGSLNEERSHLIIRPIGVKYGWCDGSVGLFEVTYQFFN